MVKKGKSGNKEQLLIALELSNGVLPTTLIAQGWKKTPVYEIKNALDGGWKPDLSQAAIDAAPHSLGFGSKGGGPPGSKKVVSSGENPGGNGDGGQETPGPKPIAKPAAGYVSLAAIQIKSQYTPIMYMARLAAEKKWGWAGDIAYEDFIDVCLYHFFKDRGITLQGFIVDDEVNKPDNGEIKELKEKVQELIKVVEEAAKK